MTWQRVNKGKHRRDLIQEQMVTLLPRLRRFARNLTGDADGADELVQMTCERALQRLHQYRDSTRLDSWLYRIVYTQWIDRTRRRQRRSSHREALREVQESHGDTASSPRRMVSFMVILFQSIWAAAVGVSSSPPSKPIATPKANITVVTIWNSSPMATSRDSGGWLIAPVKRNGEPQPFTFRRYEKI